MKATGIVRRIDDLGRVVIPKEIRRTMRIREGDPLEIYTETGGQVIFKKYSPIGELSFLAAKTAESLLGNTNLTVLVCDRESCVAASGISKKEVLEKDITFEAESLLEKRKAQIIDTTKTTVFAISGTEYPICAVAPIITAGDLLGGVFLLSNEATAAATESDLKLATVAAAFLGKQLEE